MKKSVLVVDYIGKIKFEISATLKKFNIQMLQVRDEEGITDDFLGIHKDIGLVIWIISTEDNYEFSKINKLKNGVFKNIPLIIVSNYNEKKYVFSAIKSGASDYIVRPFDQELLIKKVNEYIPLISSADQTEDEYDEEKIVLTLKDILSISVKSAMRGNYPLSILMIAIMNSAEIEGVDVRETINMIMKVMRMRVRETDTIIKYGTDNILVVLPFTEHEGAYIVDKKIRSQLISNSLLNQKAEGLALGTSYVTYPKDGKTRESLLSELQSRLQTILVFTKEFSSSDIIK
jgi:PleD family two-component response regulator